MSTRQRKYSIIITEKFYKVERSDLTALKQYYTNAARQVPSDSHYMQTLNHKFGHSQKVLQQGRQILLHTPELQSKDETFRNLAQKALLFHDVGRFEETVRRYKAEQNGAVIAAMSDEYEHCAIGYELLKNQPEYNDMRILFAVRWHGRTMEEVRASAMYQQIKNLPQFEINWPTCALPKSRIACGMIYFIN